MHWRVIAALGMLLPSERREWSEAMLAELDAVPPGLARKRFARGCARALLVEVVAARLRVWTAYPATLAAAAAAGLVIALADQSSGSRVPMWIALIAASSIFSWCRPAAAWRWGLLVAVGIPLLAAITDAAGPYAFDRADAMYGIPPAVLVAVTVGSLRKRIARLRSSILLIAVSLVSFADGLSAQPSAVRHDLTAPDVAVFADSAFADYLRGSPYPSLAFVVVRDGRILFARGYGTEDAAGKRPVIPDSTVFWMASLSKLITVEAVMRQVGRGRIALHAPAARYLGRPLPSRQGWREITIADLLTHTAGLDEPFMMGTVDDSTRLVELSDYVSRLPWRAGTPPGDVLRYSNHGMALAGSIVERTSGVTFANYVEREIFADLGMNRSTFGQPIPPELLRHLATAGTDNAVDYLLPAPAGAMVGTASDMGRFLAAQLDSASPHASAHQIMHATHWRPHREVPGVALGWFETNLGGVRALYHTGARHHFSVAWLAPSHRTGLFLILSMRQGGKYQNLRTEIVRAFAERYFTGVPGSVAATLTPQAIEGLYRPALLATTTVERAAYMFLDTPVHTAADGRITMRLPGGPGTITASPIGGNVFEVREGPQAWLRVGFTGRAGEASRMVMGGTLLDPVVFTRLRWWQRGILHAIILGVACLVLVTTGLVQAVRWFIRGRKRQAVARNPAWKFVGAAGAAIALAATTFATVLFTTPELDAADHMRSGLRVVLVFLSCAAFLCMMIPIAAALGWRRRAEGITGRAGLVLFSLAGVSAAILLWHYRLVGFHL